MKKQTKIEQIILHTLLIIWSLIVLFPIYTLIVNSFKIQREIFINPFAFPANLTLVGYQNAIKYGNYPVLFRNSLTITIVSLIIIMFFGSLASYSLVRWKSVFSKVTYVFFIVGMMIPIKLASLSLIELTQTLNTHDNLLAVIPIYIASGIPISILVTTEFIRNLPSGLIDAARIDGATEFQVYLKVVLPLCRPALATVAIFNMVPIWNDFWWPLILLRSKENRTIQLGVSLLFGEFSANWTNILSVLSLAALPMIILYLIFSRQFIKGLTAGAMKG